MKELTSADIKKINQLEDLTIFNDIGLIDSFNEFGIDQASDIAHILNFSETPWNLESREF